MIFISLTDIARNKNAEEPKDVVKNWMRSRATIEFLGLWEQLNNPYFKGIEFDPLLHGGITIMSTDENNIPIDWMESVEKFETSGFLKNN